MLAFVVTERAFSPTFQACVKQEAAPSSKDAAKENNSTFEAYIRCSGEFIEAHNGSITALATIIIAAFTGTLWAATTRQAQLTKEALIADKRAFVFAQNFQFEWESDPATGHFHWRFRPVWQNAGDTPTRRLRIYSDSEFRTAPLPAGFVFTDGAIQAGAAMLGPKATGFGGAAPLRPGPGLSPVDIAEMQHGRKFFYVWGWARYFDTFPETGEHITRFCWQIIAQGDPFTFVPGDPNHTMSFANLHHPEGNCADDECPY